MLRGRVSELSENFNKEAGNKKEMTSILTKMKNTLQGSICGIHEAEDQIRSM